MKGVRIVRISIRITESMKRGRQCWQTRTRIFAKFVRPNRNFRSSTLRKEVTVWSDNRELNVDKRTPYEFCKELHLGCQLHRPEVSRDATSSAVAYTQICRAGTEFPDFAFVRLSCARSSLSRVHRIANDGETSSDEECKRNIGQSSVNLSSSCALRSREIDGACVSRMRFAIAF